MNYLKVKLTAGILSGALVLGMVPTVTAAAPVAGVSDLSTAVLTTSNAATASSTIPPSPATKRSVGKKRSPTSSPVAVLMS